MTDVPQTQAGSTNRVVSLPSQPAIDPADFQPLDQRLLQARTVFALVAGSVLTAAGVVALAVLDRHRWVGFIVIATVVVFTALAVVATRVSFRYWGYLVREQDLTVCHGVLNRTVTSVSFNRVQHASVNSGPLERWLGLATLRVYTAGGVGADVVIEGLRQDDAAKLQSLILHNVAQAGQSTAALER